MILNEKLQNLLKEFYSSGPKYFISNIEIFSNKIIKLFVDSINVMEFKRDD
mgnify:CR=1 FL=1